MAHVSSALQAIRRGALEEANTQIALLRKRYPHSPLTGVALGDFFIKTRAYTRADQVYAALVARYPAFFYPRHRLLVSAFLRGAYTMGAAHYEAAQRLDCWDARQRCKLADIGAGLYAFGHQFAKAVALCRSQVEALLQGPLPAPTKQNSPSPPFNRDQAWQTLVSINRLLRRSGFTPFPTAGTLLGWQRQGELLPCDKDLDMALPPGCDLRRIKQLVLAERNFTPMLPDMGYSSYFSVLDQQTGCSCDILLHRREGAYIQHGWFLPDRPPQEGRLLLFSPYRLVEEQWQGETFYRPLDSDRYLRELYGDWRTPDPMFDGVVGPYNLVGLSPLTRSFAWNKLLKHLEAGRRDRARALLLAMRRQGEADGLLDQVLRQLEEEQA